MNKQALLGVRIALVLICVALAGVVGLNVYRRYSHSSEQTEQQERQIASNETIAQILNELPDAVEKNDFPKFREYVARLNPYWKPAHRYDTVLNDLVLRGRIRMLDYALNGGLFPVGSPDVADIKSQLLKSAMASGQIDIMHMLLARGANPDACDPLPALDWIAMQPTLDRHARAAAETLLRANANVNLRITSARLASSGPSYDGYTPLMVAARSGNTEIAKLLLAAHADVTARNAHHETAVTVAEQFHHPAIAQLIRHPSPDTAAK